MTPECRIPGAGAGCAGVPPAPAAAGGRQRLQRAAQDFESLLVGAMLRTMRQTTQAMADSEGDGITGEGIMNDVMDEHLAAALARGGGMGLGKLLGTQLEAQRQRQESNSMPGAATETKQLEEKP